MKNNKPIRANLLALTVLAFLIPVNPVFAQQSEDVRKSREAAAMAERDAADERRAMLRSAVEKDAKMRAAQKAAMMAEEARKSREAAALAQRNIAASRRALLRSTVKRQAKAEAKMRAAEKAKMMAQDARKARINAAAAELKAADERRAMLKAAVEKQAMADAKAMQEAEANAAAQAKAMALAKAKAEEQRKAKAAALAAAEARRKSQAEAAARKKAAEAKRMAQAEEAQLAAQQAASCQAKFVEIRNNETIKFAIGSANLSTRDTDTIDVLVEVVKSCPAVKISIEGHTDSSGPADNNLRLSQRRAAAVMNYIVKAGVAKDRLSSRGHGETRPIAPNDTIEGRRQNRRIEFLVK